MMTMSKNNKKMYAMMAAVWAVAIALVWGFWKSVHPEILNFHEEYQLFLFNTDYFCERLALPGGLAAWVGEFFTQFFYMPTIGALLLAVVTIGVQMLLAHYLDRTIKGNGKMKLMLFIVSFIPAIFCLCAMGDESVLPNFIVSIDAALLLACAPRVRNNIVDGIVVAVLTLLSYWIAGPVGLLTLVLLATMRLRRSVAEVVKIVVAAVLVGIMVIVNINTLPYPAWRIINGIFYYRYVDTYPLMEIASIVVIAAIVFIARWLSILTFFKRDEKSFKVLGIVTSAAVIALAAVMIPPSFDRREHEQIRYDYFLRQQNWAAVMQHANAKTPDLPFSVCATNLALAMQGQLCDEMFNYFQNGEQGLMPMFVRDYFSPMAAAEVFWHLGLVNTSQRYVFESMESIPNGNKSGRIMKRLAQTNIINGQYGVARKYLRILSQTLFYRSWAEQQLAILNKPSAQREKAINGDPVYGRMRKMRLDEDFLFSEQELDKIMGRLFIHNPDNGLAMQYLIAFPLVTKNPQLLQAYLQVVNKKKQYYPQAAREAMAILQGQPGANRTRFFQYLNSK